MRQETIENSNMFKVIWRRRIVLVGGTLTTTESDAMFNVSAGVPRHYSGFEAHQQRMLLSTPKQMIKMKLKGLVLSLLCRKVLRVPEDNLQIIAC